MNFIVGIIVPDFRDSAKLCSSLSWGEYKWNMFAKRVLIRYYKKRSLKLNWAGKIPEVLGRNRLGLTLSNSLESVQKVPFSYQLIGDPGALLLGPSEPKIAVNYNRLSS